MKQVLFVFITSLLLCTNIYSEEQFLVGTGVYDVTGPAGEVTMAGYAHLDMKTGGILTRLRSRAFVIEASGKRVVFACADILAIQQGIKLKVVEKLQKKYGDLYTVKNVMLNANHTHSAPGGYAWYTLYNTYILGFSKRNFDAIVDGICESISRAHDNVAPGKIFLAQGALENTAINRSLGAYQANIDADQYPSTDTTMTVLKFQRPNGKDIGMISWFGVHTTSVYNANPYYGNKNQYNTNRLISSDNKGWAGRYFEKKMGTDYNLQETFVAAFANGALGDQSPNVIGNLDGGGVNSYASSAISGKKQFDKAWELFQNAKEIQPRVDYRHTFRDFSDITVQAKYTDGLRDYKTSYAAIGLSFAAGVERDGPSRIPHIKEGMYDGKYDPAHGNKLIFLETGKLPPRPWTPNILPVQIFTIGNLAILGVPAETTVHAGRRMRKVIQDHLAKIGVDTAIITSPTNTFASYVSTREEYNQQHYEGGSTLFGQWTCAAYQQIFSELAEGLANGTEVPSGPTPPDLTGKQIPLAESTYDLPPKDGNYGDIANPMPAQVERLSVVNMDFWGANPRNTFKTNDSFFIIEQKLKNGWKEVRYDYDLDTAFLWFRVDEHRSKIKVIWDIPNDVEPGIYRIYHSGKAKDSSGNTQEYSGYSNEFEVVPSKRLWISHCFAQANTIHFRLEYPGENEYDLLHKTKYVESGKILFYINGQRDNVYQAVPNKAKGVGYFSAHVSETVTSITVPAGSAQDAFGNGNLEYSTRSLK